MTMEVDSRTGITHEAPNLDTIHRRFRSGLVACGLLVVGLLQPGVAAASPPESTPGCYDATITGESHRDPASGAFIGTGGLGLDGQTTEIQWVSVITSSDTDRDGTLTLGSSHHITGNGIDFTTSDVVTAVPTDVPGRYVFCSHLKIISASGRIKQGFLDVQGRVDLVGGDVILDSSSGTLCSRP